MSSTKVILHSCVPALTMHKYILIHHAHTAFHLHLKMSSVSLIAAHSQFSLLMDGKFNFQLKVLHLSQTNWVVVDAAELGVFKGSLILELYISKIAHIRPWKWAITNTGFHDMKYCKAISDAFKVFILDILVLSHSNETKIAFKEKRKESGTTFQRRSAKLQQQLSIRQFLKAESNKDLSILSIYVCSSNVNFIVNPSTLLHVCTDSGKTQEKHRKIKIVH